MRCNISNRDLSESSSFGRYFISIFNKSLFFAVEIRSLDSNPWHDSGVFMHYCWIGSFNIFMFKGVKFYKRIQTFLTPGPAFVDCDLSKNADLRILLFIGSKTTNTSIGNM